MALFRINYNDLLGYGSGNGQTWININTSNNFTPPGTLVSGDYWLTQVDTNIVT